MYSLTKVFFYGVSENSSLVSGFKDLKWSITVMLKQCECHSSENIASDIIDFSLCHSGLHIFGTHYLTVYFILFTT